MLEVLKDKCEDAFQACPAYEVLLRRAEKDEAQLEALNKVMENSQGSPWPRCCKLSLLLLMRVRLFLWSDEAAAGHA